MASRVDIWQGALLAAIEPMAVRALTEIGDRALAEIEQSLSVPVGRDWSGRVIQRSMPGEPPRMEEDILRQNGSFDVQQDEEGFYVRISFNRPAESPDDQPHAAQVLEFGGANQQGRWVAPRPFMVPAMSRIKSWAMEVVNRHFAD